MLSVKVEVHQNVCPMGVNFSLNIIKRRPLATLSPYSRNGRIFFNLLAPKFRHQRHYTIMVAINWHFNGHRDALIYRRQSMTMLSAVSDV